MTAKAYYLQNHPNIMFFLIERLAWFLKKSIFNQIFTVSIFKAESGCKPLCGKLSKIRCPTQELPKEK